MQADRSSTMAGGLHQTMDQTPNLPQIDQRAVYGYQYRPAHQYGYELALDERYGTMSWSTLELQARKGWNEGTMGLWDRYKDAVRFGWERGVIAQRG